MPIQTHPKPGRGSSSQGLAMVWEATTSKSQGISRMQGVREDLRSKMIGGLSLLLKLGAAKTCDEHQCRS